MSKYDNAPIKLKLVVALINMIVSMAQSNASFNQPLPAPKPGEGDVLCSMFYGQATTYQNGELPNRILFRSRGIYLRELNSNPRMNVQE